MQLISLLPLLAVLLLHTVAAQVRQSWEKVNIESQRYHLQDEYDEYEYDPNAIEGKVTLIMDVKTSSFLFRSARQCCRPPGQVIQILIKWKYLYFSHFYHDMMCPLQTLWWRLQLRPARRRIRLLCWHFERLQGEIRVGTVLSYLLAMIYEYWTNHLPIRCTCWKCLGRINTTVTTQNTQKFHLLNVF